MVADAGTDSSAAFAPLARDVGVSVGPPGPCGSYRTTDDGAAHDADGAGSGPDDHANGAARLQHEADEREEGTYRSPFHRGPA